MQTFFSVQRSSCILQCSKPSQPQDEPIPKTQTVQDLIDRELEKPENHTLGEAFLLVVSNSKWSGSIRDSSRGSATRQGYENENIPVVWMPGGIYSVSLQKKSRGGYLGIAMILSGDILAVTATNAEFGDVSISGRFPSVSTNLQTEKKVLKIHYLS
jgi:hypothetical protein